MNDQFHTIWTQVLQAAEAIHVAMCRIDSAHPAQSRLNDAMHCCLIAAEECRQQHESETR